MSEPIPSSPEVLSGGAGVRSRDPFLERERGRYGEPLPSREWILQQLSEAGVPLSADALAQRMEIAQAESESFDRRLRAMERDGQIMRNRRNAICVVQLMGLITGRVQGHPDGHGLLLSEAGGEELFLGPWEMSKVLHGDRVVVRRTRVDRRGRPEAAIVEVLERANARVVGRLQEEHGIRFVVAENRRISQDILLAPEPRERAQPGQVVLVEIIEQPNGHVKPMGRVVEVLGDYGDAGMEVRIALFKHDLPHEFSPEALALARKLPQAVRRTDLDGRVDLRELPLVTIDSETARDFDDAIHCRPEGDGFRLWVAIADVSHYVAPEDALDLEARERGNSVYFPREVIPMLPEKLSTGLCSLNPDVERLCLVCEMEVGGDGELGDYRFYPAVIRSHARLTYTAVARALERDPVPLEPAQAGLLPHLLALHRLYRCLIKARVRRGALDFDSGETRMEFDDHGKISAIVPVQRNDAHRIVEECMLAANATASHFLDGREHPCLYRVHLGPTPEKLRSLRTSLAEFGLQLGGGERPVAKNYANLLQRVEGRPDAPLLRTLLLRSLSQATYTTRNEGHFGLAFDAYTHFTSPIRRYPDLLVHRCIRAALAQERYEPGDWEAMGAHCSQTERRADEATRDVEAWLKCYYLRDRVGEHFTGSVSGVAPFGVFVALDAVYVEGMVHISELGADYFVYDAARQQLLGERTGKRYRLGDRLAVRLVRADLETTRIDFVPEGA